MTDTDGDRTVSTEAHQRVVTERDQFKAQVETLTGTVKELHAEGKAKDWFFEKGVTDPDKLAGWTKTALPHLRTVEPERIAETLNSQFAALLPTPSEAPVDGDEPPADEPPTVDTTPPGAAQPSPGAAGAPAGAAKKFGRTSPEWQKATQANDQQWFREMDAKGLLDWQAAPSPGGRRPT